MSGLLRVASCLIIMCFAAGSPAHAQKSSADADPPSHAQRDGWEVLFDGRTLAGWESSGDLSAWGVVDGEIRVVRAGRGGWLRTERMFRDFELEVEFLIPPGGNSGVGLRGTSSGDPAFTGMEIQIYDSFGRPPSLHDCGAVYDAIPPESQAVRPPGEWNAYRIRLVGDTLDVWLNGVQIHTGAKIDRRGQYRAPENPLPLDTRATTGHIAFQDHGEGGLRLRNIRIRDLSPDPDPGAWTRLIPSAGLDGWTARGGGSWTVEGGTLVGADGPGHLFTNETFADFELRALVRVNTRGNSGIYFRTVPRPENPDTWPLGFEAQVDNHDPKNFTGSVYDLAWPAAVARPITRDNAWFDYRVRAVGDHVQTWINGVPMVDARLAQFVDGHIALQTHHQGNRIEYRDLRVRRLDADGSPAGASRGGQQDAAVASP